MSFVRFCSLDDGVYDIICMIYVYEHFFCFFIFPFYFGQMIGMERWVKKGKADMVEDLLVKLREDGLVPNIYTYNGVLFV